MYDIVSHRLGLIESGKVGLIMQDNQKTVELLNLIKPCIEEFSLFDVSIDISKESRYLFLLKAALVKNFEFNIFIWNAESKYSFFSAPTLRAICEDIITLNFIGSLEKEDAEKIAENLSLLGMFEASKSQVDFFSKKKPNQPILDLNKATKGMTSAQFKTNIQNIAKKYQKQEKYNKWKTKSEKYKGSDLPSISEMAKSCELGDLYQYLYQAASSWVHFSPNILLRMGWGNSQNSYNISIENFSTYYLDFTRFYATYLFIQFYETFHTKLSFPENFNELVGELKSLMDNKARWPELLTFEEMNFKPPSQIIDLLSRSAYSLKKKEEN